jgi:hypothetical protein
MNHTVSENEDYTEAFKSEIVNITAVLKPYALGNDQEIRYFIQIH